MAKIFTMEIRHSHLVRPFSLGLLNLAFCILFGTLLIVVKRFMIGVFIGCKNMSVHLCNPPLKPGTHILVVI